MTDLEKMAGMPEVIWVGEGGWIAAEPNEKGHISMPTKYIREDTRPVPSEVVEQAKHAFAIAIGDILYMANERNEIERFEDTIQLMSDAIKTLSLLTAQEGK